MTTTHGTEIRPFCLGISDAPITDSQYGLHGGDIGAGIVGQLAAIAGGKVLGVHVTSDPGSVAAVSEHPSLTSPTATASGWTGCVQCDIQDFSESCGDPARIQTGQIGAAA